MDINMNIINYFCLINKTWLCYWEIFIKVWNDKNVKIKENYQRMLFWLPKLWSPGFGVFMTMGGLLIIVCTGEWSVLIL